MYGSLTIVAYQLFWVRRRVPVRAVELDLQAQVIERVGVAQCIFIGDEAGLIGVKQGLIESLHAEVATFLHDLLELGDLAFEDHVRNQRGIEHDLDRKSTRLNSSHEIPSRMPSSG